MDSASNAPDSRDTGAAPAAQSIAIQSTNSGVTRDLAIEYRPVTSLVPYARNARTHSDAQIAEIAASIRAFGWTNPILMDGENGVIAGHGRLLAARKLGLEQVPVIELAGLSDADKRAYIIADNKLALNAGWDEDLLAAEVTYLDALGIDLKLAGFGEDEIGSLLNRFLEGTGPTFLDEAPDPPADPVTRPGDLWVMREHRLLCGDALKKEDITHVLDGRLVDMVFTDPPYNVAYEGKTALRMKIANDDLGGSFPEFLAKACGAMLPVTKGAFYICMSSSELTR